MTRIMLDVEMEIHLKVYFAGVNPVQMKLFLPLVTLALKLKHRAYFGVDPTDCSGESKA